MKWLSLVGFILYSFQETAHGINNGLGIKPPMGWRSWNCYHSHISQHLIESCIDAVVDTSRKVDGVATSLADIGYGRVGVDDNWQLCNASGHYFHNDTAPNGWPVVNETKFPDLTGLVSYAHDKNVLIGWYMNNCICSEKNPYPANEVNDVKFLVKYDFDGIKLDGCSTSHNITHWQHLINMTSSKALLTENCHNQPDYPTDSDGWCPFNFFRSSNDINTNYVNIISVNLASTIQYNEQYPTGFITRPGCWAYPDMLEVGNIPDQYNASAADMDQSHFSAWCVVSAPLILGFDLTNNDTINAVWDIITNPETIAVSQNWAGHPGRRIAVANYTIKYENMEQHWDHYGQLSEPNAELYGYEIWAKPQPNNTWAVLLLNLDGYNSHDITVDFKDVPWNGTASVRDLVNREELGTFTDSYTASNIPPFGSAFIKLSPTSSAATTAAQSEADMKRQKQMEKESFDKKDHLRKDFHDAPPPPPRDHEDGRHH